MGQSVTEPSDDHHSGLNGRPHRGVSSSHCSGGEPLPIGYHYLRRICRERGILFEDPEFCASTPKVLSGKHKPPVSSIAWMRPFEICSRPKFFCDATSRMDIELGEFGDHSLLAAISCLIMTPRFLDRVVPQDQFFNQGYCGIFRFRFWKFGDWIEIVVDDRLPTYKGKLLYMKSADPSEFWPALLEKAYAKFYGGYGNLHGGKTSQALQDLTGGVAQNFQISEYDSKIMFQTVNSAVPRSTLLAASINTDSHPPMRLRNGLITKHAYSVTGIATVRTNTGELPLIRLRNPWGKGEWNGPWSDRSWEWDSLNERDQLLLSERIRNDGEFWMSFDDFVRNFTLLDLLHVGPDDWMLETALHSKRPWRAVLARRRWRTGFNSGGGPTNKDVFATNPQFRIHIRKNGAKKCHIVVSVVQYYGMNPQTAEQHKKATLFQLGITVYEVPANMAQITNHFVRNHQPLDVITNSAERESVLFFVLPAGDYVIVPFTRLPDCDTKFLLRIFTDEPSTIWEVNDENIIRKDLNFLSHSPGVIQDHLPTIAKELNKMPLEVDPLFLQKFLKSWREYSFSCEKPSLELCKNLVMLRDPLITGRMNKADLLDLMCGLKFWRHTFLKYQSVGGKVENLKLRSLLWEIGITVSNKVLECIILRFSKTSGLSLEAFLSALVKVYLAHERYTTVEKKMKGKGKGMTIEEMILLTVYS